MCRRRDGWHWHKERDPTGFRPGMCRRPGNGLRESIAAAILPAADAGSLLIHLAVHPHLGHRHGTVRSARHACKGPDVTRQAGKRWLPGQQGNHKHRDDLEEPLHAFQEDYHCLDRSASDSGHKQQSHPYFAAVSAATGTSMSCLRMIRLVAFSVASSKPWPCVMASVGQASTQ
jgi:hypothetical protein